MGQAGHPGTRQGATLKVLGRQPSLWPFPSLSPDLDFAVCAARETSVWDMWLFDERGGAVRLTDDTNDDDCPVLSPSGRFVYFCKGNTADWRLVRRAVDGTGVEETVIAGGELPPDYASARPWLTADGRLLIYATAGGDNKQDIAMIPLGERVRIGTAQMLFPFPGTNKSLYTGLTDGFDMTPDGQTFLVVRWHENAARVADPAHIVVVENWIKEFK